MAAGRKHKTLIEIFELRFDYQSARTILGEALGDAEIEAATAYDGDQIEALASALSRLTGDAIDVVAALVDDDSVPAAKSAPAPAEVKEDEDGSGGDETADDDETPTAEEPAPDPPAAVEPPAEEPAPEVAAPAKPAAKAPAKKKPAAKKRAASKKKTKK